MLPQLVQENQVVLKGESWYSRILVACCVPEITFEFHTDESELIALVHRFNYYRLQEVPEHCLSEDLLCAEAGFSRQNPLAHIGTVYTGNPTTGTEKSSCIVEPWRSLSPGQKGFFENGPAYLFGASVLGVIEALWCRENLLTVVLSKAEGTSLWK